MSNSYLSIDCPEPTCGAKAGRQCFDLRSVGGDKRLCSRHPHAMRRRAGKAAAPLSDDDARLMLARLGLPVEAMMAVRARFYACASKHGVAPGSSRPDRTPDDHYSAAMRHLGVIASGGYDLLIPDLDDPGTHLAAAMCRGLLALDGVSRG